MTKTLTALATAATIAVAAIAVPSDANARGWHRGGWGWGPGAVIGGLAAGALIAGAAGAYGPYYGPGYPAYAYGPGCYIRRERFWDGWAWRWHRVRVCN